MNDATWDHAGRAGVKAGEAAARLGRLPFALTLWRFVTLIALGGVFEFCDLFMTACISPGLTHGGLFPALTPDVFSPRGVGLFVFSVFAAMLVMCTTIGLFGERARNRSLK